MPTDGATDDVTDGGPSDLHEAADDGLVRLLGEEAGDLLEIAGEGGAQLGPGHCLCDDGMAAMTVEAPQ